MAIRGCNSELFIYLQAYFVTIATILGTGILGLPVMLSRSGLYPFLVTFVIDAFVQSLLVCFFVDLLQRAVVAQHQYQGEESMPLNAMLEEDIALVSDDDDGSSNVQFTGAIMKGKMLHIREIPVVQTPNLHLLGKLFLGCGLSQAFDVIIILQFIALLICYALAGSEAFAQLIGIHHFYVIPVFVWVLTLAIVFALQLIKSVVSFLTFIKGTLLLGTAAVTFYVGLTVAETVSNDFASCWSSISHGNCVVNTMPYTFEKIAFKKKQISKYHAAVQAGLWTCVLLNIIWCWTVLEIVPQTVAKECAAESARLRLHVNSTAREESSYTCVGEMSLESAAAKGEISTIPLTKLLKRDHPHFTWVAILIQVFILVSISVSYLTIGTALHHTLSGIVQTVIVKKHRTSSDKSKVNKKSTGEWCMRTVISLAAFALVFAVAMMDPEGFIDILEKLVSFTLNAEVGLFIFLMLVFSKRGSYRNLEIPLPTPRFISYLVFFLPLFFNFAVFFDIYDTTMSIIYPQHYQTSLVINTTTEPPDSTFSMFATITDTNITDTNITGTNITGSFSTPGHWPNLENSTVLPA
ncbi:unnamed protein product [Candidula unifasciata]|uniref:Uncharacterized protein n=1 Tax=Candidula unifasciata TaxID=100452 RepID=A0A8S3YJ78_9EUPU|nr:unnamed protein product [Candidula unifasciata]